jgi:acetyltransferase-like isoleucine patch superfamily enzyme
MYLKLKILKLVNQTQLQIGKNMMLKYNSRIGIWNKEGKINIGDNFSIGYHSELYVWKNKIMIGNNSSINDNCKIYGNVRIGSNCLLASNIYVSSGIHTFSYNPYLPIKIQDNIYSNDKPVIIEDDCWIGFGVVIISGVYIGEGAVIGANSVVTKDVFPYTINAGVPSKPINKRLEFLNSFQEINVLNQDQLPFFYRGCNYQQFNDMNSIFKGLEIIEEESVFLLAKSNANLIRIKGYTDLTMDVQIYYSEMKYAEVKIDPGVFDLTIRLNYCLQKCKNKFQTFPQIITQQFDIVLVQITPTDRITKENNIFWKINSIGSYVE